MAQVFPPHEEEIVEIALFTASSLLAIRAGLLVANAFQFLPLALRLLKNFPLLIAGSLRHGKLPLQFTQLSVHLGLALRCKPEFSRSRSCSQLLCLRRCKPAQLLPCMRNLMPHFSCFLVRCAQTQLLLVLKTFAKMQHGLQRKTKCHVQSRVFNLESVYYIPSVPQPGNPGFKKHIGQPQSHRYFMRAMPAAY